MGISIRTRCARSVSCGTHVEMFSQIVGMC